MVIINWILSLINKNQPLEQSVAFERNDKSTEPPQIALNLNDILNGYHFISTKSTITYFDENFSQLDLQPFNNRTEYFVPLDIVLKTLKVENITRPIKIINIQGVCQLHYYLTIVSLYGSLIYTLACLMDRLFRLKVIYKNCVIEETVTQQNVVETIARYEEENNKLSAISSHVETMSNISYTVEEILNISNQNLEDQTENARPETKRFFQHSEFVRQFFG